MYECGRTLAVARGNTQDLEAKGWYQRAAEAGYEPAKKLLKMLNVAQYGISGFFS